MKGDGGRPKVSFGRVALVGTGLIGCSLGMELRLRKLAQEVVGFDIAPAHLQIALARGALDKQASTLSSALDGADLVLLAVPPRALLQLLPQVAQLAGPHALVTDLGSVKKAIVALGESLLGMRFVGGHPMAGAPEGGPKGAKLGLFEGAPWAIVRSSEGWDVAVDAFAQQMAALAQAVGAQPIFLDAAMHDRLAALVSHLPHLISFAFQRTIAQNPDKEIACRFSGGSYRDLIRVAQADRTLWEDIFLQNREELLKALTQFEGQLSCLRKAIEDREPVE